MKHLYNRRKFLSRIVIPSVLVPVAMKLRLNAQDSANVPLPKITRSEPKRRAPLESDLVREFVSVSHGDHDRVQELIEIEPKLVYASLDHGGGDWEMGLGAASHSGRRDIADTLLLHGARKNIFAAAMLGEREVVEAMINADPKMSEQIGPHGFRVLYHVAISGDVQMAKFVLPHLKNKKPHLNQSLSAALRDGHYDMTRWLLEQGVTNVNKPNPIGEKPLETAIRRGDTEIADLLREYGAIDVN